MAPKKTNIKIKRSKFNLYNKKKSKTRQALKIVITIVVICGLGVLGYGLGKPLLKYIQDRGNSSQTDSDTSALLSNIMDSVNSGASGGEQTSNEASGGAVSSDQTSEPTPPQKISDQVYYLPENAALSESSLKSALAEAKKSGCSIVAVTLKDTTGHLLYKTSIEKVKDTDTVTGKLTAAQIAQSISSEGFVPAARINTLMDRLGSVYVRGHYTFPPEQGGYGWNDDRVEKGGKPWMSPFKTESVNYISDIANELSSAGYKHIICANTRYPAFHNVDINNYLAHLPLNDPAKRTEALWNVVTSAKNSAEKNGADIWLEMNATSVISDNRNCTDAELTADTQKLKNVKITVNYDISNTSSGSSNTSSTSSTSSTSNTSNPSNGSAYYQNAKNFISKAKAVLGGAEFAVRLPQTLTGTARENVIKAFTEANITVF